MPRETPGANCPAAGSEPHAAVASGAGGGRPAVGRRGPTFRYYGVNTTRTGSKIK